MVLIDFGAVKRVTAEEKEQKTIIIGTPGYMPIEQFKGEPTFGSDLYAAGMICIQALTGIKPKSCVGGGFPANSELDLLWQQSAQVSDRLSEIITKMVRCNHRERYLLAKEALQDIQELDNSPQAVETIIDDKKQGDTTRNLRIFIYISLVAAILAGITGIKLWQDRFSTAKLPLNGKMVTGILSEGDICNVLLENIYCKKYIFLGKKGQQVTIEMNSNDFDPYLVLQTPDGNKLAVNGDISPQDWNAKISFDLPGDGKYLVIARTSYNGESGNYTIRGLVDN